MVRFKSAWKGYDKKAVEEYISKTNSFQEGKIRELEECVERLKYENDYLYRKNAEYRRNEERISGAIVKAMEVKNNLEKELRGKIAAEEDRLRVFKTKWCAYTRGINRCNADRVVDDIQGYIEEFKRDFVKKANRDLDLVKSDSEDSPAERSYRKERQRVRDILGEQSQEAGEKMSAASLDRPMRKEDDADPSFIEE